MTASIFEQIHFLNYIVTAFRNAQPIGDKLSFKGIYKTHFPHEEINSIRSIIGDGYFSVEMVGKFEDEPILRFEADMKAYYNLKDYLEYGEHVASIFEKYGAGSVAPGTGDFFSTVVFPVAIVSALVYLILHLF